MPHIGRQSRRDGLKISKHKNCNSSYPQIPDWIPSRALGIAKRFKSTYGKAEPCLTSGGKAVATA
jgi:hypothetical protein